jgi:rubredoxin
MKSIIAIFAAICLFATSTLAFAPTAPRAVVGPAITPITRSIAVPTNLSVFGKKKTEAQKAEEAELAAKYWAGEWVCKDCGYIYNRAECAGMYFEEQGAGFRCPQCSGPRRRYAKKVGDRVGTTLDGGDGPILLFSFGGLIATIAFGIWAVENL